jgi:hypothetical protein
MLEDDEWWKRRLPSRSNITVDWSITGELATVMGMRSGLPFQAVSLDFVSYILKTGYFDVNDVSWLGRPIQICSLRYSFHWLS